MERLRRYNKKAVALLMALGLIATSVFSTSFISNAAQVEINVNYAEPATSDSQGYIHLLLYDEGYGYFVKTFFWSCYAINPDGAQSPVMMYINADEYFITFSPYGNQDCTGWLAIGVYDSRFDTCDSVHVSSSESYEYYVGGGVIRGYIVKGNGYVNEFPGKVSFVVNFSTEKSAVLLQNILDTLISSVDVQENILSGVETILTSVSNIETQIEYLSMFLRDSLDSMSSKLSALLEYADKLLVELEENNTWLENLFNLIMPMRDPSYSDLIKAGEYQNEVSSQKSEIDSLNEQNKMDKVDVNSASGSVDTYIDGNAISNYGALLSVFTNHEYIVKCILVVLAVGLVAYVLFGKRR